MKDRTVANRKDQWPFYSKIEIVSLIVHVDSFMVMTAIEAFKKRDTETGDVLGAFLCAAQKNFTIVKFVDKQVDIICEIEPDYKKFVTHEGSKKVLCLMLLKVLYGTLTVSLLWYD